MKKADVARRFGVSRARVTQLTGIVTKLPRRAVDRIANCNAPDILMHLSGRHLLAIVAKPPAKRTKEIAALAREVGLKV